MTHSLARAALVCMVVVAGLAGCKTPRDRAPAAGSATAVDPSKPVARIGQETITRGELDAKTRGQVARMEAEQAEKVHGLQSQTLEQMIEERLIAKKAKAEGITPEQLVEREVTSKLPEPAAAEVQQVYDQTKASGRPLPPFDQVKGEIAKFLKQRNAGEARKAFVDKLKTENKVETMLPPLLMPKIEVAAEGPSKGAANAPITIVEFSDFECPYCVRAEEAVNKVMEAYKGKVRLVYRDYPLPFHAKAQKASEAALCAGDQGKYWEMHGKLFANQQALDLPQLKQHAKDLGARYGQVRQVPGRRRQGEGGRRLEEGRGGGRCHRNAGLLHQRSAPVGRPAVREVQGDHRPRAGRRRQVAAHAPSRPDQSWP